MNFETVKKLVETRFREVRKLDTDKIYQLCNREGWYTHGDNEDYNNMFGMCRTLNMEVPTITVDNITSIALDICIHSDRHGKNYYECEEDMYMAITGMLLREGTNTYLETV